MYKEVLCLEVLGLSVRPHYHNNRYHHHLLPLHHHAVVGGFHQVGSTRLISDNSLPHNLLVEACRNTTPGPKTWQGWNEGFVPGFIRCKPSFRFPQKTVARWAYLVVVIRHVLDKHKVLLSLDTEKIVEHGALKTLPRLRWKEIRLFQTIIMSSLMFALTHTVKKTYTENPFPEIL